MLKPIGTQFDAVLAKAQPDKVTKQLEQAERYLANAIRRGEVGAQDTQESARQKRIEFVNEYGKAAAIDHLYREAYRYEVM